MNSTLTYDDLFQDKFIYETAIQSRYYDEIYPDLIKERNRKPTRFLKYALNFCEMIRRPPKKKGNLLFLEHRFERIASNLSIDYNIFLLHDSINIYKKFVKEKYHQFFYRSWLESVDKSFITHDMSFAVEAMKSIQSYLSKFEIDLVLTGNDKMFMERLLLTAAQNINIPTVVIQHGLYTDELSFGKWKTADTAENFWTWSQYIKDCYLDRYKKDETRVKVIGYPFELLDEAAKVENTVLFLGNNYRKRNNDEGMQFLEIVMKVLEVCEELGAVFYYRPHPGEIIDSVYSDISEHIRKGNSLMQDLDSSSIVIGDLSSAMVEAALCGRNVIQIIWNDLSEKASRDPMFNFTIKVGDKKEEIKHAITYCLDSDRECQLDEYYMFRNPNLFEDIRTYIEELIVNKEKKQILSFPYFL